MWNVLNWLQKNLVWSIPLAMLAGLATVGVMLVWQFGSRALLHYVGFVGSALLMGPLTIITPLAASTARVK